MIFGKSAMPTVLTRLPAIPPPTAPAIAFTMIATMPSKCCPSLVSPAARARSLGQNPIKGLKKRDLSDSLAGDASEGRWQADFGFRIGRGRRSSRCCRATSPARDGSMTRRVISGIVHVLKAGCRWKDCPAAYGPPTTVYNHFNRWSRRGLSARSRRPGRSGGIWPRTSALDRRPGASLGAWWKRGAKVRASGSRGGPAAKIHPLTDGCGRAVALLLTPREPRRHLRRTEPS